MRNRRHQETERCHDLSRSAVLRDDLMQSFKRGHFCNWPGLDPTKESHDLPMQRFPDGIRRVVLFILGFILLREIIGNYRQQVNVEGVVWVGFS